MLWFTKAKRAQNVDDYETWNSGGVVPTLNAMDNSAESFATVLIFYGNRVDDIRVQGQVINTLQARMGTGGNNMPMVARLVDDEPILMRDREGKAGGGKGLLMSKKSFTLSSSNFHTLFDPRKEEEMAESTVRRLTPTECERLQGFPDGWTAEKWDWKKEAVVPQADSARYKQMGNAVAVPVVDFLVRRLVEVLA